MLNILKKHFGYDSFRPGQEEIIDNVLAGRDTVVLMPTGGGKSLCFQLPALKYEGITLVISPLIALMKDQVDALKTNGIAAEFINSSLTARQIRTIKDNVMAGKIKIIYLAPERLSMESFRQFLQSLPISLIAIDEAHCISEWGHDFRPEYRNLKTLKADFPGTPIIALTATATLQVRNDITKQLNLDKPGVFISSFNRHNLSYNIEPKRQVFNRLVNLLERYRDKAVIIYAFSRKDTEKLAIDLNAYGFSALPYHAGLDNTVRRETQEKFIRDEINVIVATIAFGMGIDKPDVRLVIHYDLPKTIEGYYQETGRAGRDGLPAECVLFYSWGDRKKHDYFIEKIEDPEERRKTEVKLRQILEYCELVSCRRKHLLNYFGEQHDDTCGNCDNCLSTQEEFDATEITQKILSAVLRTGQRFGAAYIAGVLCGQNDKKIMERGHDRLSVFGIVTDLSSTDIKKFIPMLAAKGLLAREGEEYPILKVTPEGLRFLKQKSTLSLPKLKESLPVKNKNIDTIKYDETLFEQLRSLRKQIADQRGVPPFVIFGDKTLQEMACYLPQTEMSLSKIHGVGSHKLAEFGRAFLEVIDSYAKQNNLAERRINRSDEIDRPSKRQGGTYAETKELVKQKLPLAEIAKRRKLTLGTVTSHLEKIVHDDPAIDIGHLKPDQEKFDEIFAAFNKLGSHALSPVFNHFNGKHGYDDLRLARIFFTEDPGVTP